VVLSLGLVLLAAGTALGLAFLVVGVLFFVAGLGMWIAALLPGQGHFHEPLAELERRPKPATTERRLVEQLRSGMPGYRMRLPLTVHPTSAGIKGGLVGGVAMLLPAFLYGLLSKHGMWYPVNLLCGMVLPEAYFKTASGTGPITEAELEQFSLSLLLTGIVIHLVMSVVVGLVYGVLLPTLPAMPGSVAWGGLLMPLLWTAISFSLIGVVNPVLHEGVSWPWFIISQFVFGMVAAGVFVRARADGPVKAGLLGGAVGGLVMPLPAFAWGVLTGNGPWYPVNLLAAMILPGIDRLSQGEQREFNVAWLAVGFVIHAALSLGFGVVYGVLLPRLPDVPGAFAWGGMVLPLLWTGISYGLMGVVNPILQERVDWPWFIISQFVFGAVAAIVVDRSEKVPVPPAGLGR
jgi:hypothetical protein